MKNYIASFLFLFAVSFDLFAKELPVIRVSSKAFTENYLLAEIISQIIEATGQAKVERKFGLSDTALTFEALKNNEIDIYPEYTGTLSSTVLKDDSLKTVKLLQNALAPLELTISNSLGFNNASALAVRKEWAHANQVTTTEDLNRFPNVPVGFGPAFIEREDCYPLLQRTYGTQFQNITKLEHGLAYEALRSKKVDVIDIYTTDAKISKLNLAVLEDNKNVFPKYFAVLFAHKKFVNAHPQIWNRLKEVLESSIDENQMIAMNSAVELEGDSFATVARRFLSQSSDTPIVAPTSHPLVKSTKEHLYLVSLSMLAAILVAVPLGILAANVSILGQVILLVSGIIQTIPSLALLCFFIPLFGIGALPALIALFLYSLLPIVRNTYTGITGIDPKLKEVCRSLGLTAKQSLIQVTLPLASRSILAGIKTAAIINIGTATLAALIGAGGYGEPIITGLAMNNISLILEGAIPAAALALVAHFGFELLDRVFIPEGIR